MNIKKVLIASALFLFLASPALAYSRGGSYGGGAFRGSFSGGYSRSIPVPRVSTPSIKVSPGYSRTTPSFNNSSSQGASRGYTGPVRSQSVPYDYTPAPRYTPPQYVYVNSGGSMGNDFWFWMWLTGRQSHVYVSPAVTAGKSVTASASSTYSASSTLAIVPCTHHWFVFWKPKCKK